ncbi:TraB domain-containing protein [Orchesella cincta]|uniref:TraB domain-containing protein n=1 Tax=Orchesella cincta TaxID=48709 RepID=A0A1D2M6N1_ORCCI|nr:TraB domain-containing protein [Orchesella cincta]
MAEQKGASAQKEVILISIDSDVDEEEDGGVEAVNDEENHHDHHENGVNGGGNGFIRSPAYQDENSQKDEDPEAETDRGVEGMMLDVDRECGNCELLSNNILELKTELENKTTKISQLEEENDKLKQELRTEKEDKAKLEENHSEMSTSLGKLQEVANVMAEVNKTSGESSSSSIFDPVSIDEQNAGESQAAAPSSDSFYFSKDVHRLFQMLPKSVTVLKAPNGLNVYVVGTSHFSWQSQVDVINTIQLTHPTLVLLELCSSRRNTLSMDEETVLKEVSEMNFQKIRLALSNSGMLHLLLLSMSALTRKLGMAPGGEFRAAMSEASNIPGCVLLLGDRPLNITISRALAVLTFRQKIKLAWQFLTSNEDITKEEIEKCNEKDLLERMLSEMTGEFPSITEVFGNERDVYLAHSLYLAATSDRSNGGPIVGVVGMGHVPGIVKNWAKTSEDQIADLVK